MSDLAVGVNDSMDGRVFVATIISDNDSTMRSHLQHAKRSGILIKSIHQSEFLVDPSYGIKVIASLVQYFSTFFTLVHYLIFH